MFFLSYIVFLWFRSDSKEFTLGSGMICGVSENWSDLLQSNVIIILYIIYYILYIIDYILYIIHYMLYVIYYILYVIYYLWYIVDHKSYMVYDIWYMICDILYIIYYILYIVYRILYIVYIMLYYTILCIYIYVGHTPLTIRSGYAAVLIQLQRLHQGSHVVTALHPSQHLHLSGGKIHRYLDDWPLEYGWNLAGIWLEYGDFWEFPAETGWKTKSKTGSENDALLLLHEMKVNMSGTNRKTNKDMGLTTQLDFDF